MAIVWAKGAQNLVEIRIQGDGSMEELCIHEFN
jgi:hypothetical protein